MEQKRHSPDKSNASEETPLGSKRTGDDVTRVIGKGKSVPLGMSPSQVLKLYYFSSFSIGIFLVLFLVHWISIKEISIRSAAIINLSFNVILIMLLPLVLDWAETRYFKARFLGLEEIAKTNPHLASSLEEQCKRLSIAKLRLAIVDSTSDELFSYGLWRTNPRLVLSHSILTQADQIRMLPSVEAELARFASQDRTWVFLTFTLIQQICQMILLSSHLIK